MKKILALLLALTTMLSLAACGGKKDDSKSKESEKTSQTQASEPPTQSDVKVNTPSVVNSNELDVAKDNRVSTLEITGIKIGKANYAEDGLITLNVTVDWKGDYTDSAWIGIIPADVPHGEEEKNDEFDMDYRYFKDLKSGAEFAFNPITMEPGDYTLRVNEKDDGGAELAFCNFKVNPLGKVTVDDLKLTVISKPSQSKENNIPGSDLKVGKNWPTGGVAALVPAPGFDLDGVVNDDKNLTAKFVSGTTLDEARAYVKEVKNAGFNNDVVEFDQNGILSFTGYNKDRVMVSIAFSGAEGGMTITKN